MLKKAIALLLAILLLFLSGCTSSLENFPNGERPSVIDGKKLYPKFPPAAAAGSELNYYTNLVVNARDFDTQLSAYKEVLRVAYTYVMGPYNLASYYASDGGDISYYQEEMNELLQQYVTTYDQKAYTALQSAQWSKEILPLYSGGAVTAEKVRNAFPTTTQEGQVLTQNSLTLRDQLLNGMAANMDFAEAVDLLSQLTLCRNEIAAVQGSQNYIDFCFTRRDAVPYQANDMMVLADLVAEHLVPKLSQLTPNDTLPVLTSSQWQDVLPAIINAFDEYGEDLVYCYHNGLMNVAKAEEDYPANAFSYMLYQYGFSIGKARISESSFSDTPVVLKLVGSMARDMHVSPDEWAMGEAQMASEAQTQSFVLLAARHLTDIYGSQGAEAQAEVYRLVLQDTVQAAMEYEVMHTLHLNNADITADELTALAASLSEKYGLPLSANDILLMDDVYLGLASGAQRMMGGLTAMQLDLLAEQDEAKAKQILQTMFGVYNYTNPIELAVQNGLPNPFSRDGVAALAAR